MGAPVRRHMIALTRENSSKSSTASMCFRRTAMSMRSVLENRAANDVELMVKMSDSGTLPSSDMLSFISSKMT